MSWKDGRPPPPSTLHTHPFWRHAPSFYTAESVPLLTVGAVMDIVSKKLIRKIRQIQSRRPTTALFQRNGRRLRLALRLCGQMYDRRARRSYVNYFKI